MRLGKSVSLLLLLSAASSYAAAQDLPRKIRGYTVHKDAVTVSQDLTGVETARTDAAIRLFEPKLTELSPGGISVEVTAEIRAAIQSGKVDFLAFHDLRVNGIAVVVNEYREPFAFRKGETVKLPKPASVFIPTTQLLRAAMREVNNRTKMWAVTGRVFVFGRFRKFGFDHKRVVPIDIDLQLTNPIKQ